MNIVCKPWTEELEIYDYHIEDILSLIKEAYKARAKEGIRFATLSYTLADLMAERTNTDFWFLAFGDDYKLYGTARMTVREDSWGEICNFAVLPQSQGKHVGSRLLQAANQFAKEKKLDYIMSYTAIKAISSVKCHCNNGFEIVGIGINLRKDYSSYVFRNQLAPSLLWSSALFVKLRYMISYIRYRLIKKSDGGNTILARLILLIKKH